MSTGIGHALKLLEKYSLTSTPNLLQLRAISLQEGLIVKFFPFSGSIKAIYYRTLDGIELLTIKSGLREPNIKHILAYGLACLFLNRPPAPYAHVKVIQDFSKHGFDVEAENFATVLLVPPPVMSDYGGQIPACEISRLANIPISLAQRRIDLAKKFLL